MTSKIIISPSNEKAIKLIHALQEHKRKVQKLMSQDKPLSAIDLSQIKRYNGHRK
ncbi:MAG: hypothetical protein V4649_01105 [Bacteroidota bacterium]